MPNTVDSYIGLGSNLSNPSGQVGEAIAKLNDIPDTSLVAHSSLYASQPMGPKNQPDFINAVAKIRTCLEPHTLLSELLRLELQLGRKRPGEHIHLTRARRDGDIAFTHWGPRVIDLDLLLYGDQVVCSEELMIPHPGLLERDFVVHPLLEISPDLTIPKYGLLADHVDSATSYQLKRLVCDALPMPSSR